MAMTEYSDFKVEPRLADVVVDAAADQFDGEFRAKSRAGHEALVAWLVVRADSDVVQQALEANDFDSIDDLVQYLEDGRFSQDDQFDPFAAVETPRDLDEQYLTDPSEPSNHDSN